VSLQVRSMEQWVQPPAQRAAPVQGATADLGLCADVAGIEGAGYGGVLGAFEDGAPVGENGHFIGWNAEAEQKFVVTHLIHSGGQAAAQEVQVEDAATLVDLNGVSAAHGDVWLGITV
jgi:hypothetical protein